MTTWVKVVAAIVLGGALGAAFGGGAQWKLIFSIYYADHISRNFTLSGEMCLLLGAVTGAAFVLLKEKAIKVAARLFLSGGALCLIWLSIDRDSQLYHWWNLFINSQNNQSFEYWYGARNTYYGFIVNALIFNGFPLLWAVALMWWGLKLLGHERKQVPLV